LIRSKVLDRRRRMLARACGGRIMPYYFSKTLDASFEEAVTRTRAALAQEGFGVISEIDIQKTLKAKIGADFPPYLILGACNPTLAHQALQIEALVGTMLPCNVVVRQTPDGRMEVAAIDPVASMASIDNPELAAKAALVGDKLRAAIARL
jgi:uncharacterized protein (DUF302 family)